MDRFGWMEFYSYFYLWHVFKIQLESKWYQDIKLLGKTTLKVTFKIYPLARNISLKNTNKKLWYWAIPLHTWKHMHYIRRIVVSEYCQVRLAIDSLKEAIGYQCVPALPASSPFQPPQSLSVCVLCSNITLFSGCRDAPLGIYSRGMKVLNPRGSGISLT